MSTIEGIIDGDKSPTTAKNLTVYEPRTPDFYLLHTIHKESWTNVSVCSCPTEQTSSYLEILITIYHKFIDTQRIPLMSLLKITNTHLNGKEHRIFTKGYTIIVLIYPKQ